MCIWTADCMRRKKSRKCVCNRGKSQIERERERNEKERIHCFENGSYILFNTTTASSNSCSRLLNTQAYIEKPWVALDRQVLFFFFFALCIRFLIQSEKERTFDCVIRILYIAVWLHLCIFERERGKKKIGGNIESNICSWTHVITLWWKSKKRRKYQH
jgi:hypothetical protein